MYYEIMVLFAVDVMQGSVTRHPLVHLRVIDRRNITRNVVCLGGNVAHDTGIALYLYIILCEISLATTFGFIWIRYFSRNVKQFYIQHCVYR